MTDDRYTSAVAAIDAANADDPHTIVVDGQVRPKEQAHAEMMTAWVERLDPTATDAQLLAARAHHLRRWVVAREEYAEGRAGYLRWRADAKRRHADEVATILEHCGYDADTIGRVQQIVRKEGLRNDPAVQTHEDALCLVFLQTQLGELADQLGRDKGSEVLRKTLAKMSEPGRRQARDLHLDEAERALVVAALEEVDG